MSQDDDIDIETFRRSRADRTHDAIASAFPSIFHRGWQETEAEVRECRPLKNNSAGQYSYEGGNFSFGNHYVAFTYEVSGKCYQGETFCRDQLQKHDRFTIRYNPRHPEQHNTIDSELNWAAPVSTLFMTLITLFLLSSVVYYFFTSH